MIQINRSISCLEDPQLKQFCSNMQLKLYALVNRRIMTKMLSLFPGALKL